MRHCASTLRRLGITHDLTILSAHRQPAALANWAEAAAAKGYRVVIAGAGLAAHLAGAIAARTALPVIGVPVAHGALRGLDAFISTSQMPAGVPVATMSIGDAGAVNAALLAARILALADPALAARLAAFNSRPKRARA
jgi:5-(carboxyamino)imidazole ribonucleotide mutase